MQGQKTSEFWFGLLYILAATAMSIVSPANVDKWLMATAPVAGSYIIGRSIVKRNGNAT